ncbi:MAG: LamG-like jellyroll fold domain-containing protein [Bacteroidota bacterium]
MKLTNKKHPFFILLFLFPLLAVAQNDNRLVAYYTLEGNADDQSGNDNHGTTFNVDPATGYKGNSETAYQFRNANQSYISVPHSASLSLNKEMTLMAWIYYEDQASSNFFTLLEKTNPDFEGHSRYGMWVYNGGTLEVCVEPDNCPNNLCQRCLDSNGKLEKNAWNHVAGTYDGTYLRTYINGKLSSEFNYGEETGISQTAFELFLGTDLYSLNDDYLTGRLDEVRIYNETLTDEEIYEIGEAFVPVENVSNSNCSIYPTLTQEDGTLFLSQECKVREIRLMGLDGRLIFEYNANQYLNSIDLSQHDLSSGIYFLQIMDQEGALRTEKFVIQGY